MSEQEETQPVESKTAPGGSAERSAEKSAGGSAEMRALVADIAKALVDEPDKVTVSAVDRSEAVVLQLVVAPNDLGKVIGKQGRTARSIRTLLGAASMKLHKRYTLEIVE